MQLRHLEAEGRGQIVYCESGHLRSPAGWWRSLGLLWPVLALGYFCAVLSIVRCLPPHASGHPPDSVRCIN